MANGGGPPDRVLRNEDYQTIKNGECVASGEMKGCILVEELYYWLAHDLESEEFWLLMEDELKAEYHCLMSVGVWEQCCGEGTLKWNAEYEAWAGNHDKWFRWGGVPEEFISLVPVEF